jgi:putative Ca2+/H+ antiporter (TMEM165/GDT1 family)
MDGLQGFSPWNLGGSYRFSLKAGQVCSQSVHHPWNKKCQLILLVYCYSYSMWSVMFFLLLAAYIMFFIGQNLLLKIHLFFERIGVSWYIYIYTHLFLAFLRNPNLWMYNEDSHQGYSHLSFALKKCTPMTAIPSTPLIRDLADGTDLYSHNLPIRNTLW